MNLITQKSTNQGGPGEKVLRCRRKRPAIKKKAYGVKKDQSRKSRAEIIFGFNVKNRFGGRVWVGEIFNILSAFSTDQYFMDSILIPYLEKA